MASNLKSEMIVNTDKREIVITRIFDAPRALVYQVFTEAQYVPQWWAPGSVTTRVDTFDVRPGGRWRVVQRDAEGKEYVFSGVYQEVVPPERLVYTFEFEDMPGHIVVETVILEAQGDAQTLMTVSDVYQSVEDLEGMLGTGMEEGAIESYDRLSRLLEALQQER
jgi:uncharacterized protein YndB with AHSA1/START domain